MPEASRSISPGFTKRSNALLTALALPIVAKLSVKKVNPPGFF